MTLPRGGLCSAQGVHAATRLATPPHTPILVSISTSTQPSPHPSLPPGCRGPTLKTVISDGEVARLGRTGSGEEVVGGSSRLPFPPRPSTSLQAPCPGPTRPQPRGGSSAAQGFGPTLGWLDVGLREARGARHTRPPASRRGVGSLSRETGTPASAQAPRLPQRPAAHGLLIPLRASGTRHPAAAGKALRPAAGNPRGHGGRTPAGGSVGRPPHPARPHPQRPTGGGLVLNHIQQEGKPV